MTKNIKLLNQKLIESTTTPDEIIEILLENRQIKDSDSFLSPSLPSLKLKLKKTLRLINTAIKSNQNILIYGDYDVDGITATAILWQSLYKLTKNVTPFVPHRERDGYGIKADSFFRFQEQKGIKFDLLITVDNGIVADKELHKIKNKQNIKIIVTDHHQKNGKLLNADVVVHSTEVSGAGLSYFLSKKIDNNADIGLATLGTVADCLPITGVNRSLVVHGLKQLNKSPSPGIKKLIQISSIKNPVSTYELGFVLGPRINAVGRLADPTEALRLLCCQNMVQATRYAHSLNSYNQDRQILQKESIDDAETKINLKDKLIIIDGNYNPGIIGLIAGRLTEKYYLPTIIMSVDGDTAKGSCRSIPELNIIKTLHEHQELFIDLGGHSGAAGFSISVGNISKFKQAITKSVNQKLNNIQLQPHLDVDAQMTANAITIKNINSINKLAPFGIGNPEPLFLFKNLSISSKKIIGSTGDHLKLELKSDSHTNSITALAFKKGDLDNSLNIGDSIDVVASLSINEWNKHQTPQLIIKEIIINHDN